MSVFVTYFQISRRTDLRPNTFARMFETLPTWCWFYLDRMMDTSPTGHFAYYLDSSPTDCSSFYQKDYQSKIKSDVQYL